MSDCLRLVDILVNTVDSDSSLVDECFTNDSFIIRIFFHDLDKQREDGVLDFLVHHWLPVKLVHFFKVVCLEHAYHGTNDTFELLSFQALLDNLGFGQRTVLNESS